LNILTLNTITLNKRFFLNILVLGSGGREHAICWSISKSKKCKNLYCIPGNGGISSEAKCYDINPTNKKEIFKFCLLKKVDLVVIGPEKLLYLGMADYLTKKGINTFGPTKKASQLETSKIFAKKFLKKNNIPTGNFTSFNSSISAINYVESNTPPFVIKVDGLAEGKGVIICNNRKTAIKNIKEILDLKKFGVAGDRIIIEEFLVGYEISYFAFFDQENILPFEYALDHKKAKDNDLGLNTGGMGAFTPFQKINEKLKKKIFNEIILPTKKGLKEKKIEYRGVIFFGLIITKSGPKVIEYNVRFGDPECQVILRNLNSDLLKILNSTTNDLLHKEKISFTKQCSICVILASNGYPEKYKKYSKIENIEKAEKTKDVVIFHSGTKKKKEGFFSNGGRVLSITSTGKSLAEARKKAYNAIRIINWKEGFFRSDIGKKKLE